MTRTSAPTARPTALTHVAVVVPARNEERLLGACLSALARATSALERQRPDLEVAVVVALDACTDRSARVAAGYPWVRVVTTSGGVGPARAAGVEGAVRLIGCRDAAAGDRVWVACTDADSRVPEDWLAVHVGLAEAGADAVVGTVEPDEGLEPAVLARWVRAHDLADGHRHVHGANLGVRLSTYRAAGGFRSLLAHEDVALVDAVRQVGGRVEATAAGRVVTSSRDTGRAPEGFAHYLRELRVATPWESVVDLG
ncbi:glycosyltransferase family A protein [Intrasporangium sp. YIM S08009]|uniref:glycosyltransferase n=1 Tax=Intrasporangium zincisolvens TaxID=3080018 RepID=UPI002B05843B|nr:glycosyltransferase family A protein [Intrasporangium sp. YIM S08009]